MPPAGINWGLLSTARIARRLVPAIEGSSRSRLVAVGSRSLDRAREFAATWRIPVAYGSYEAVLSDPGIDAVYNALPNGLHVDWTLRGIAAGKHVLCEKPLALAPRDVDRVAAASRARGVIVTEGFMYRHHPQTLHVMDMVSGGEIGRVRLVRGCFTFPLREGPDVRLDPTLGGGCLWDVGCYPVSWARLVTGVEPVAVLGVATEGPTGVDRAFSGILCFPGDVQATFDAGFDTPLRTAIEIVGDEGSIDVEQPFRPEPGGILLRRGSATERRTVPPAPLYRGEVEDLEAAVLDGRAPRITLEDSRGNAAALSALHRAARAGRLIPLDTLDADDEGLS